MSKGATILIEGLRKSYGDFVAVADLSLAVASGEFVTLLGASGSGKTTTLMAIAGFVEPDAGRIAIGGRDISGLPPERRELGVVFQSYALFPHLDVFNNVAFPLRLRGVPRHEIERRVIAALDLVSLTAFRDRRIPQLSGGQQQRVALARALVFEPPALLMDEPLGALDRKLRDQLQGEIKRIQRELGVTVVYVTHDQDEALALSDRIAIMAEGRIAQLGTPDEVYRDPASVFVASFLGESNLVAVEVTGREGALARLRPAGAADVALCGAPRSEGEDGGLAVLRPEALRVGPPSAAATNRVPGTVELREFLGASVRLSLRTPIGRLVARLPPGEAEPALRPGAPVEISWRPEDFVVFPRSPHDPAPTT